MEASKESKKQQYEKYLAEYGIEKTITEMLNSLVHEKSKTPIVYMIKYLAGMLTDEQRKEHNLMIPEPFPQNIPLVKYPELESGSFSLLKSNISRRIWQQIKYNKTKTGATIMDVIKQADEKIGAALPDGDSVRAFAQLLDPMIRSLNPDLDEDDFYNENENESEDFHVSLDKVVGSLKRITVSYSRNLKDNNFMSTITTKQLEQNEEQIKSTIEQLEAQNEIKSGKYLTMKDSEGEIRSLLSEVLDYDKLTADLNNLGLRNRNILSLNS
jgi:hypothetical protein